MAQRAEPPSVLVCPVCLELLKTPVTLPCGHSYCLKCIQDHWDKGEKRLYTCPECRLSFTPRPVLAKNIMLAALLEQRTTEPPADRQDFFAGAEDLCGPEDVSCDVCSVKKLRAVQSCLQCVASYCERHLQPHHVSAVLQRHQLVAPLHTLQENICSEHNELKKMFCRTEQQIICYLCSVDQHKDHEVVSSASERAQREAQLGAQRHLLLQNLQHKDSELSSFQQQEKDIRDSAHTALQLCRDSFRDMILLLETRAKEVEQQIQSEVVRGLRRIREIQDQVKQELSELKQSLCDLDTLSLTKDHTTFLQLYSSLASLSQGPVSVRGHTDARSLFEEVTRAVSELEEELQLTVDEGRSSISLALSRVQLSLTEPKTREEFLQYSTDFTLDLNTAHPSLSLSDGNETVTFISEHQEYPDHQDRFSEWYQVLSRESVTGRCYWEVEWSATGVYVSVSYRDIQRKGLSDKCRFGLNNKSWALECYKTSPSFWFDKVETKASGPVGSRIGVFLDHRAGVLSFYNVSENMTLIHREETTFSQPLHAGVEFSHYSVGDFVHFPKLKQ